MLRIVLAGSCSRSGRAPAALAPRHRPRRPAPIALDVDASDAPRRIFHVRRPSRPRRARSRWPTRSGFPGEHGPAGPITDLVGLKVSSRRPAVAWKRVPTEMWSFTAEVPAGGAARDVAFDYVPPLHTWTTATAQILVVNWWPVLLYPKGPNDNATMFAPTLRLPAGWKYGTALPVAREPAT